MTVTAIVLLIIGGLFYAISFFLPDGKKKEEERITEEEIRALIEKEMASAKERIDDMVEETVNYSVEKTERRLEKLSNEKIMAVDEYSETVLKKINDNHNEAVFLYDMLNDKDEKLKATGEELKISKEEIEISKTELENKKRELEEKEKAGEAKLTPKEDVKEENSFAPVSFKPMELEHFEVKDGVAVPVNAKKTENPKPVQKKAVAPKQKTANKEVTVHLDTFKDSGRNNNEMIRKLHEEGKSNMQIAKELGLGVGEVKLVIDLFSSKRN